MRLVMRKILIILLIVNGFASSTFGQGFIPMVLNQPALLSAVAGHDTLCCKGHPVVLGGTPTATGGSRSYVYLWTPSDGLDNPTSSNPTATLSESISYSLSVTDGNGCQAISRVKVEITQCLGIDEKKLNPILSVFPNPSNGIFTIHGIGSFSSRLNSIEVLNQLGQVVFKRSFEMGGSVPDLEIDTKISEPGIYFLRVSLSDRIVSQKLIVR